MTGLHRPSEAFLGEGAHGHSNAAEQRSNDLAITRGEAAKGPGLTKSQAEPAPHAHDFMPEDIVASAIDSQIANTDLKAAFDALSIANKDLTRTVETLTILNASLKTENSALSAINDDFSNFFHAADFPIVVLDEDLRIRSYTPQALAIFSISPGDRGRSLLDIACHIEDPDLYAHAREVAAGGAAITRYVASRDRTANYQLRISPFRAIRSQSQGATLTFGDVTELHRAHSRFRDERNQLQLAVQIGRIGVWSFDPRAQCISVDCQSAALFGLPSPGEYSQAQIVALMPDDPETLFAGMRESLGADVDMLREFRARRPDGVRWIQCVGRKVGDCEATAQLTGVFLDITADKLASERQTLLLQEMDHRIKNLFAVVSGVVSLARAEKSDVHGLVELIRGRINALASAHAQTRGNGNAQKLTLEELLERILAPFSENRRIVLAGPAAEMDSDILTTLGLIFHECATNSAKYGAFSALGSAVSISWDIQLDSDGRPWVALTWSERFDLPARPALGGGIGFGSRMIDSCVRQLSARLQSVALPDGYRIDFAFPLKASSQLAHPTASESPSRAAEQPIKINAA